MYLVTANKPRQILHLIFAGRVTMAELQNGEGDLREVIKDFTPGFTLITDLERAESIEPECARPIGATMELCDRHGIGRVIRVIPDQAKDIGFNILSAFHYTRAPRTLVFKKLIQAVEAL
ncbi:MAG TPA: hypothetical protein VEH04_16625 [Verrucomicrobiae bacterium]|nr:hypothetical protein [Verrucomicrobiae bacterium]